jgi:hypothetical protein
MGNDGIPSPGEEILAYFEEILHPVMAGFSVFGGKSLRGRFRGEDTVHL